MPTTPARGAHLPATPGLTAARSSGSPNPAPLAALRKRLATVEAALARGARRWWWVGNGCGANRTHPRRDRHDRATVAGPLGRGALFLPPTVNPEAGVMKPSAVDADGICRIKTPPPLSTAGHTCGDRRRCGLSTAARNGRLRVAGAARWRYDLSYDATRDRWYLTRPGPPPRIPQRADRAAGGAAWLGVDLMPTIWPAACGRLGNPIGDQRISRFPLPGWRRRSGTGGCARDYRPARLRPGQRLCGGRGRESGFRRCRATGRGP